MHDLAITSRVERTVTITWGVKYFALPSIGNCHKNMIPHIALEYWKGFTQKKSQFPTSHQLPSFTPLIMQLHSHKPTDFQGDFLQHCWENSLGDLVDLSSFCM